MRDSLNKEVNETPGRLRKKEQVKGGIFEILHDLSYNENPLHIETSKPDETSRLTVSKKSMIFTQKPPIA